VDLGESPAVLVGTPSGAIFRALDGDESWSEADTDLGDCNCHFVSSLAVANFTHSKAIYAGTESGGGFKRRHRRWAEANKGIQDQWIRALAIDPKNPNIIYAGGGEGTGVYKSANGGDDWAQTSEGLPGRGVLALAIDPEQSNTLYAGVGGAGPFASGSGVFK